MRRNVGQCAVSEAKLIDTLASDLEGLRIFQEPFKPSYEVGWGIGRQRGKCFIIHVTV